MLLILRWPMLANDKWGIDYVLNGVRLVYQCRGGVFIFLLPGAATEHNSFLPLQAKKSYIYIE